MEPARQAFTALFLRMRDGRPDDPKPKSAVADRRRLRRPVRNVQAGGRMVEAASSIHAVSPLLRSRGIGLPRRFVVGSVVPVPAPFPDVPVHVEEPPGIGQLPAHRMCPLLVSFPEPRMDGRVRSGRPRRNTALRLPARQAYSHSASVGRRYPAPLQSGTCTFSNCRSRRTASAPPSSLSLLQNRTASSQETPSTGCRSPGRPVRDRGRRLHPWLENQLGFSPITAWYFRWGHLEDSQVKRLADPAPAVLGVRRPRPHR